MNFGEMCENILVRKNMNTKVRVLTDNFEKCRDDQRSLSGLDEARVEKVGVRAGGNDMNMWHLLRHGQKLGFYFE